MKRLKRWLYKIVEYTIFLLVSMTIWTCFGWEPPTPDNIRKLQTEIDEGKYDDR